MGVYARVNWIAFCFPLVILNRTRWIFMSCALIDLNAWFKRDMNLLEHVQWWAIKLVKALECLLYEKTLTELGLFKQQKWRLRGIEWMCINSRCGNKGGEPRVLSGAQWTGYPEGLRNLLPRRCIKPNWPGPGQYALGDPALSGALELWLWSCLFTSIVLWFCYGDICKKGRVF